MEKELEVEHEFLLKRGVGGVSEGGIRCLRRSGVGRLGGVRGGGIGEVGCVGGDIGGIKSVGEVRGGV